MDWDEFLDYVILEIDYRVDPELRDDPGGRVERPEKGLLALPASVEDAPLVSWDEALEKVYMSISSFLAKIHGRHLPEESIDIDDSASC